MNKQSPPPSYLTDRVKDFKKIWRAYFLKDHPAYPAIESFLTETIEQSIEMGRREGYKEGVKDLAHRIDCNTLISELSGWRNILEYSVEQVLKVLSHQKI